MPPHQISPKASSATNSCALSIPTGQAPVSIGPGRRRIIAPKAPVEKKVQSVRAIRRYVAAIPRRIEACTRSDQTRTSTRASLSCPLIVVCTRQT